MAEYLLCMYTFQVQFLLSPVRAGKILLFETWNSLCQVNEWLCIRQLQSDSESQNLKQLPCSSLEVGCSPLDNEFASVQAEHFWEQEQPCRHTVRTTGFKLLYSASTEHIQALSPTKSNLWLYQRFLLGSRQFSTSDLIRRAGKNESNFSEMWQKFLHWDILLISSL